ncbi:hypothetical protein [Rothia sp. 11273D007AR]
MRTKAEQPHQNSAPAAPWPTLTRVLLRLCVAAPLSCLALLGASLCLLALVSLNLTLFEAILLGAASAAHLLLFVGALMLEAKRLKLWWLRHRIQQAAQGYRTGVLDHRKAITLHAGEVEGIYRLTLQSAPGYADADVLPFLPVLASDLKAHITTIADPSPFDGQVHAILSFVDLLAQPLGQQAPTLSLPATSSPSSPCTIGINRLGQPVSLPLYAGAHGGVRISVAGRSGSGKNSPVTQLVLHALACGFTVWLADPKQTELRFAAPAAARYESDPHRIGDMLTELQELMRRRQERVARSGASCWSPQQHGPPILFVFDELTVVTRGQCAEKKLYESAEAALIDLSQRARSAGISLLWVTQQLSATALPTAARSNFDIRISMSVATSTDAEMAIPGCTHGPDDYNPATIGGSRNPDGTLSTVGTFCIGGDIIERGRSYYVSPARAACRVQELTASSPLN